MDAINENIEKKNVINYNYYKIGETGWYKLNNNFVTFIKKCNSFHDIYGRDAKNDEMIKIRKNIEQEKEIINKIKSLLSTHGFKIDNIPESIKEIVQDLNESCKYFNDLDNLDDNKIPQVIALQMNIEISKQIPIDNIINQHTRNQNITDVVNKPIKRKASSGSS